jgi:hypothetical protein
MPYRPIGRVVWCILPKGCRSPSKRMHGLHASPFPVAIEKEIMKWVFIWTVIAATGLVFGCARKPLEGQAFIVSEARINFPLGAMQIEVVDGKQADDFMQARQAEIQLKKQSLQAAFDEASSNCEAASKLQLEAQNAAVGRGYTNNPDYFPLLAEKEKDSQIIDTLTAAMDSLERIAYPANGQVSTFRVSQADLQAQRNAYNAIEQDGARIRALRPTMAQIDQRIQSIKDDFLKPYRDNLDQTYAHFSQTQAALRDAEAALKSYPKPDDYFQGFSPKLIASAVTDASGNFSIVSPSLPVKIFATAQRQIIDSTETYYWLVEPPQAGQKLILSNENMFTAAQNPAVVSR